jgi:hypothetical protein
LDYQAPAPRLLLFVSTTSPIMAIVFVRNSQEVSPNNPSNFSLDLEFSMYDSGRSFFDTALLEREREIERDWNTISDGVLWNLKHPDSR